MSQFWVYTQQGWAAAPNPFTMIAESGSVEAWFKAQGYEPTGWAMEFDPGNIEIWRGTAQAPYAFLIDINWDWSAFSDFIGVSDLPALLEFLRQYGQIGLWPTLREELAALKTTLARAFEAWHGHNPDDLCAACDRCEHEMQQVRLRAMRVRHEAAPAAQEGPRE